MIEDNEACAFLLRRIEAQLLRLNLVSHAPSQAFNPAPPPEGMTTPPRWRWKDSQDTVAHLGSHHSHAADSKAPARDSSRRDDREFNYRQKSARFFQVRVEVWSKDRHQHGIADLKGLHAEIGSTIEDWIKTPSVPGVTHDRDTFLWKCEVADCELPPERVCEKYGVSRRTLARYRERYRGVRQKAA